LPKIKIFQIMSPYERFYETERRGEGQKGLPLTDLLLDEPAWGHCKGRLIQAGI
jgi:hypothetical protein